MIIIGHPWVESQNFRKITSIEEIKQSSANEVILLSSLDEAHTLAQYCHANLVTYAITSNTIKDALFANAMGAKYMLCDRAEAAELQTIAQEYLFDMRILVKITDEDEILSIAKTGIDGVIFPEAII